MMDGFILDDLTEIRDELYDSLPSGKLDAFNLIKEIKKHISKLDKIVDYYSRIEVDEKTNFKNLKSISITEIRKILGHYYENLPDEDEELFRMVKEDL